MVYIRRNVWLSFKEYVKKYGKYPFKLLDKEGKEHQLLFTEEKHQKFMKWMEITEEILKLTFEYHFLYGIDVKINYEEVSGIKDLLKIKTDLEMLHAKHLH